MPGLRPPPCAKAINTRWPLILVGTVAAEVAGEPEAQDAAPALRGRARAQGARGRGRQGWGARGLPWGLVSPRPCRFVSRVGGICGGPEWARRGDTHLLWEKRWLGSPVAAPHQPPRFCEAKMTEPR